MHARPIAIGLYVLGDVPLGLVPRPIAPPPSTDAPFNVSKNGPAAALSGGVPGLDADWAVPCEPRHRRRERRRTARLGRHGRRGRRRLAGPPCQPPALSHRSRPSRRCARTSTSPRPCGRRRLSRPRDRAALLSRACMRCRPPEARCARPRRKRALPGSTGGLTARPSSGCGVFGSRPFRQARASA